MIVNHGRQMVDGDATGLDEHVIVDGAIVHADLAPQLVDGSRLTISRRFETHYVGLARLDTMRSLLRINPTAVPIVAGWLFRPLLLRAHPCQTFCRAETVISVAAFDQLLRASLVEINAF